MSKPVYRTSPFAVSGNALWLGTANQLSLPTETAIVKPGETATITIPWQAPTSTGSYREPFTFGIDGFFIMPDIGMEFRTTVTD